MNCISFKRLTGLLLAGVLAAGAVAVEAQMTGVTDQTMWGSRARHVPGDDYGQLRPQRPVRLHVGHQEGQGRGPVRLPVECCDPVLLDARYDNKDLWGFSPGYSAGAMQDNAAGKGIVILQIADGEKFVSWTGPNIPSSDTIPIIYDIESTRYGYDAAVHAALPDVEKWKFGTGTAIGAPYMGRETVTPRHVGTRISVQWGWG